MPNAKIEGTHNPIKIPSIKSPLKKSISEKINDSKAEINISLSAIVNFLNIFVNFNYLV